MNMRSAGFLAVLIPFSLFSQTYQLKFRQFSIEQGLSQSSVNAIAQDRQGYMWFGTQDGLHRFDGYTFKVYRHDPTDSTSISANYIWRILADLEGHLWIGTSSGGLNRYDPEADCFVSYRHQVQDSTSLLANNIPALYLDSQQQLWVGSWAGGLSRLDSTGKGFIHYRHQIGDSTSLPDPNVSAILEDSFGDLWVGTWNGLCRLGKENRAGKRFTRYLQQPPGSKTPQVGQIWAICEDPASPGDIWVGSYGGGLWKFDRKRKQFTHHPLQAPGAANPGEELIITLFADRERNLWVGTGAQGLFRWDSPRERFTNYPVGSGTPAVPENFEILSLFQDHAGGLWVGSGGKGVFHYTPYRKKFLHYYHNPHQPSSVSDNSIWAICEDREGGLWVGTKSRGLNYRAPGSDGFVHYRRHLEKRNSLVDDNIHAILERQNGEIWIATLGGLSRYVRETASFANYRNGPEDPASLSNNEVRALCEDKEGNLWIATAGPRGGVDRYDATTGTFVHYRHDPGNPNSPGGRWIWAIHQDRQGYMWAGSWNRGVTRFDPRGERYFRYENDPANPFSISNNTIWCFAEDQGGNLWLGTWGGGLNLYDRPRDRFIRITESQGLSNNVVYGILSDDAGRLWISTNQGISMLEIKEDFWEKISTPEAADLPGSLSFQRFDIGDGLQSNEFNQGAFCKGKNGILYFGGVNGFNAFYPDRLSFNRFIPPVVITTFKVREQPLSLSPAIRNGKPLIFSYTQNDFSAEYAALDFTVPEKNHYAYMLEGVDRDWIHAGNRRYLSYTHLDPGKYRLRIKASNNDGIWNEEGLALSIIITPPFWATWWFRGSVMALLAALIYAAYRYRLNKVLEMERLRTRLAADLHDEIAGNLSSIAMFGQVIQSEMASEKPHTLAVLHLLDRVIHLSRESVGSIRDIIWAIDPAPETLHGLFLRVHDMAANACHARGITLNFFHPPGEEFPVINLSPEQRKNLWLLMKEAIQNVLKHARASELDVRVNYAEKQLKVYINDNGQGFECSQSHTGKGLHTMRSRAEQLRGSLEINSRPGEGTTILFRVKI